MSIYWGYYGALHAVLHYLDILTNQNSTIILNVYFTELNVIDDTIPRCWYRISSLGLMERPGGLMTVRTYTQWVDELLRLLVHAVSQTNMKGNEFESRRVNFCFHRIKLWSYLFVLLTQYLFNLMTRTTYNIPFSLKIDYWEKKKKDSCVCYS